MQKFSIVLVAIIATILSAVRCQKSATTTTPAGSGTDSTFIKSLQSSCGHAFTGRGDSGYYALPTAFTPNADGLNDFFKLLGLHQSFSSFLLTIYKTNGVKVFQSTDPGSAWTGKDTTGTKCTDYKYFVTIRYTTPGLITVDTGAYLFLLSADTIHNCVTRVYADTASYFFPDQYDPSTNSFPFPGYETYCN
jgi:gliding motility-associated-like protein